MITAQLEQVRKIEQNFKSRIGIPSDDDEMIGTIRMQGAQRRWSFADPADPGDPADTSDASASEVYAKCDDIRSMISARMETRRRAQSSARRHRRLRR